MGHRFWGNKKMKVGLGLAVRLLTILWAKTLPDCRKECNRNFSPPRKGDLFPTSVFSKLDEYISKITHQS